MSQFMNEDLMWERLKDIQREVESSRLYRPEGGPHPLRRIAHALGRVPRWRARRETPMVDDDTDASRGVA